MPGYTALPVLGLIIAGSAWLLTQMASSGPPPYPDKADLLVYVDSNGVRRTVKTAADWERRREHILASLQRVMGDLPGDARKKKVSGPFFCKLTPFPRIMAISRKRVLTPFSGLELAQRGYVTLCPDYPNYGQYKFDPYRHGYASATMKAIWNHMRAVDLLGSLAEVDPARIGCIGHSLGGHNALFLAAFDRRIGAVVSSCGFTSFRKYAGGNLAGWSHAGYMPRIASVYENDPAKVPFDFAEVLAAVAPRAVFASAPLRDANFDVSGVRDCLAAVAPVFELLGARGRCVAVYPDAGHGFPPETRRAAYAFIDDALRHTPAVPHQDREH
jgi:dienelactone hydrolase